MPRYIQHAMHRARRRKSAWNLALLLVLLAAWAGVWWGLFQLIWQAHVLFHPEHDGRLGEFWPEGLSTPALISSFLMGFGPMLPSLVLAMIAANYVVWVIPPARAALEAEAGPHPGVDFGSTQRTLMRIASIAVPAGALVALLGAATLKELR